MFCGTLTLSESNLLLFVFISYISPSLCYVCKINFCNLDILWHLTLFAFFFLRLNLNLHSLKLTAVNVNKNVKKEMRWHLQFWRWTLLDGDVSWWFLVSGRCQDNSWPLTFPFNRLDTAVNTSNSCLFTVSRFVWLRLAFCSVWGFYFNEVKCWSLRSDCN